MENDIEEMLSKYSKEIINKVKIDNVKKIIDYLKSINCNIIDDIIANYFDVFIIESDEFIKKIEKLNVKYNGNFFEKAEEDLNYLEEIFND